MRKKIVIFIFAIFFTSSSFAQYFYYYYDKKVELQELYDKVQVQFEKNLNLESYNSIISSLAAFGAKPIEEFYPHHPYQVLQLSRNNSEEVIEKLKSFKEVIGSWRTLQMGAGKAYMGLSNEIFIQLLSPGKENIKSLLEVEGLSLVEENKSFQGQYRVSVAKDVNALLKANELYETGQFRYCEPNFVFHNIQTSNDPLYPNQWPLRNTGQNGGTIGADIKIEGAWAITQGRPEIKVAVVDEGVDLTHPDLQANLLTGFDATGGGNNGGPYGLHGSACAGLIAAVADNGIGIAGVAPKCKIIPISTKWTSSDLSSGLLWAAQNGADVISNSWYLIIPSAPVEEAINWATINGRGGLGCVVIFSAGNDNNSSITFPSSLSNVISVGALDKTGSRSSYSNYGAGLSVTAPGGQDPGDVWTCNAVGGYFGTFNGTSAACPHVAGVAALILSVNPCLSWDKVKKVIELSADKTGGQFCTSGSNLWNNQLGYGKLNAEKAIKLGMNLDDLQEITNPSSSVLTTGNLSLIGVCGLASATYYGTVYNVTKTINVDYNPNASYNVISNGINGASISTNPATGTITLNTQVVYVQYALGGQNINQWYPIPPSLVKFWVAPYSEDNIYLQNRTENNFTNAYRSKASIYAGNNVTSLVAQGNYTLSSQNNVKFIAKDMVSLDPGFECSLGNTFEARIGGYNTCSIYPQGLQNGAKDQDNPKDKTNIGADALIKTTNAENITVYPNPVTDYINITIPTTASRAEILIFAIDGRLVEKITTERKQISIPFRKYAAGSYLVKVKTPSGTSVKKIIKTDILR